MQSSLMDGPFQKSLHGDEYQVNWKRTIDSIMLYLERMLLSRAIGTADTPALGMTIASGVG